MFRRFFNPMLGMLSGLLFFKSDWYPFFGGIRARTLAKGEGQGLGRGGGCKE